MSILKKILLGFALCLAGFGYANDLHLLDSAYQKGDIGYLRENLPKSEGQTPEEKEKIQFYQAVTQSKPNFIQDLQEISAQENNKYAQAALLELSKVYYLEKDYDRALEYLQKVNKPTLLAEKSYWMPYCLYTLADYKTAIYWAQSFQKLSHDKDKIENGYILMSNCYLKLDQPQLALNLLLSLEKLQLLSCQRAAALYNITLCYQKLDDQENLKKTTFKLKRDFPYSKYARLLTGDDQQAPSTSEQSVAPNSYLQVGAFQDNKNALETAQDLKGKGYQIKIDKKISGNSLLYKIWVGPFATLQELNSTKEKLLADNYPSFTIQAKKQAATTLSHKNYYLECGVFTDPAKIRKRLQVLKDMGVEAKAYRRKIGDKIFIYGVVGPFASKEEALIQQKELQENELSSNLFIK